MVSREQKKEDFLRGSRAAAAGALLLSCLGSASARGSEAGGSTLSTPSAASSVSASAVPRRRADDAPAVHGAAGDPVSRVFSSTAGIGLENPKGELKPEMFADVTIHGRAREVLQVPDDAILESGTRNIVFMSQGEGKLASREISVGDHGAGVVEIRDGLKEGDVVVRGANFLVDSESRLKAAIGAMAAPK